MAKALDYIRSFGKPDMTYSVALRTMVLCAAEPKKDLLVIRQNVKWLEATQLAEWHQCHPGSQGNVGLFRAAGRAGGQFEHAVRDAGAQ